jgi:antitoxin (DNA-binding transcriptional repressor) of toxin-antitoxin stability system
LNGHLTGDTIMPMAKRRSKPRVKTLGVSEFKSHCLALVDDLHRHGGEIVLTKRGNRVAKVVPLVDARTPPLRGLFKGRLRIHGGIAEVTFADLWEVK